MTRRSNPPTTSVAIAMIWAFGVVIAGVVMIGGFWLCFTSLSGRGDRFDGERDAMLFGPYLLSAVTFSSRLPSGRFAGWPWSCSLSGWAWAAWSWSNSFWQSNKAD